MDSSVQPKTSAATIDAGENSKTVLSKREKFLSTYCRNQPWSLPDSIIYYISKNPSNSNVYKKMIQSCKYFFIKNPLLVVKNLNVKYANNQWMTSLNEKNVDLFRVSDKLWIIGTICIDNYTSITPKSLTTLVSKIYQSDVKELTLNYQQIFLTDLKFLASKCEEVILNDTTVINADDSIVGMEKIIEVLPKIKRFFYTFSRNLDGFSQNVIKPETVQKLIQLPHFQNLDQFFLREVPEIFDIDIFYDSFIKKNKKTKIYLKFVRQLSQVYRNRLQTIVNEIISTQNHDYNVPYILFSGNDFSSSNTLFELFKRI